MGPIATLLQKPGMPNPALVTLPAVQTQEPEAATPVIEIGMALEIAGEIPAPRPELRKQALRKREPGAPVLTRTLNQSTWERNHTQIVKAVEAHVQKCKEYPSVTAIANLTGISRNTITMHMSAYRSDARYKIKKQAVAMMSERVLTGLLDMALQGDLKAAKIFLDKTN
jgi:hypothetical protein